MVQINDKLIRKSSRQYDPEIVQVLYLEKLSITYINNLERCTSLIELSLAWNDITSTNGIEKLITLEKLNLSHNKLTSLGEFKELKALKYLDIRSNLINDIDSIKTLSDCPTLTTLFMRNINGDDANIACQHPNYTNKVIRLIPHLSILDGGSVQLLTISEQLINLITEVKPKNENTNELVCEEWIDKSELVVDDNDFDTNPIFKPAINSYEKSLQLIKKDCKISIMNAQSNLSKNK